MDGWTHACLYRMSIPFKRCQWREYSVQEIIFWSYDLLTEEPLKARSQGLFQVIIVGQWTTAAGQLTILTTGRYAMAKRDVSKYPDGTNWDEQGEGLSRICSPFDVRHIQACHVCPERFSYWMLCWVYRKGILFYYFLLLFIPMLVARQDLQGLAGRLWTEVMDLSCPSPTRPWAVTWETEGQRQGEEERQLATWKLGPALQTRQTKLSAETGWLRAASREGSFHPYPKPMRHPHNSTANGNKLP